MDSFFSRVWSHLGTLLVGVLSVLADTHVAISVSPDVTITLNAVAGLLVALHLVSEKTIEGVMNGLEGIFRVKRATPKTTAVDAATAAQTTAAVHEALSHLSTLTGTPPTPQS